MRGVGHRPSVCSTVSPSWSPHASFALLRDGTYWGTDKRADATCQIQFMGVGEARAVCGHPHQGLLAEVSLPITLIRLKCSI